MTTPDDGQEGARALSFGSVAQRYERYRPGYPDELVDVVLQYAARPVRSALEVGAGTGKATRLFAARGIEVTALEPDPAMARLLESTTSGLPVRWVASTFERHPTGHRVDLLYAAAAWHWTDPAVRWARAVELLAPGGVLALFGRPTRPADPALAAAVEEAHARAVPGDGDGDVHPWTFEELAATGGLVDAVQRDLPSTATTTAEEFVAGMGTVSAYLVLPPEERSEALRRVRAVLPDVFEIDTTVRLALARRP